MLESGALKTADRAGCREADRDVNLQNKKGAAWKPRPP